MRHEHCKVWRCHEDRIEIVCPHCKHRFHEFPALLGDAQRAVESQEGHTRLCPGTPSCMKRSWR